MEKRYRVGFAALVHDHVWGELRRWQACEGVDLVAVGDQNPDLVGRACGQFGIGRSYRSWERMVQDEQLDIVQAASENSVACEIVEACAAKGIHVITEKPMSATLEQANRMVRAARNGGIRLMVNWPTAWQPAYQEFERRLLTGEIGEVFYLKQRSAHNGPKEIGCDPHFWQWLYDETKNGAGAFMDYCCYGADLCARVLGMPAAVTGFRAVLAKDYPVPDDNAIVVMKYPRALGVAEASWTQPVETATPNPVAYGSEGSLVVEHGKLILTKPERPAAIISPPATEAPRRSGPEYLLHCLRTGEPIEGLCSMETSRDAQEILEAGKRAADTGATQSLPLE